MTAARSESVWDVSPPNQTFPPLDEELQADVIVVGGGIVGVTAALKLREAGKSVVLIEAHRIGSGTTFGSTAHLTEAIDGGYAPVISAFGVDEARLVAAASRQGIDHIHKRVHELGINCQFERVPGYLFAEDREDLVRLEREHHASREAGVDAVMEAAVPLPFPVAGGVRFRHQARFDVLTYVRALSDAAARAGVQIFEQTQVERVQDGAPCIVRLTSGVELKSEAVFEATHVPIDRAFTSARLTHYQSYVVAFTNVPMANALFWDVESPYHYLRSATVKGRRYVLVGGEDHKTGDDEESHHIDRLIDWARPRLRVTKPEHQWSAQLHEPMDGLPYIGTSASAKRVFVCTGLSGHGLSLGTAGALLVGDLILGVDNPLASVFDATRIKPLISLVPFVRENARYPARLIADRFGGAKSESIADLPPGEGRTMNLDGRRVAVYRDEQNDLHAVSAVCTHMGCLVKFNDVERTWDCACHGSRYNLQGDVIDGPATRKLEKVRVEQDVVVPLRKVAK
jgi:glycine/D-amino acid oxidase-like deaminating enzyme/nitrite reductase/ring-hydroxylating ferredoxin subunit